jgi:hypothetical protein
LDFPKIPCLVDPDLAGAGPPGVRVPLAGASALCPDPEDPWAAEDPWEEEQDPPEEATGAGPEPEPG